jgi:hypothetical protein
MKTLKTISKQWRIGIYLSLNEGLKLSIIASYKDNKLT